MEADNGNPVAAVTAAVDTEAQRLAQGAIEEAKAREADAAKTAQAISDAALQSEHAKRIDALRGEFTQWQGSAHEFRQSAEQRLSALETATTAALATLGTLSQPKPVIVAEKPVEEKPPVETAEIEKAVEGEGRPDRKTEPAKRQRRAL